MWQKQDVLQFLELYNTPCIFSCEIKGFMWGQCQQIVSVQLQRKTFHVLLNSCGLVSWTWSQQTFSSILQPRFISESLIYWFISLLVAGSEEVCLHRNFVFSVETSASVCCSRYGVDFWSFVVKLLGSWLFVICSSLSNFLHKDMIIIIIRT